MAKKPQIVEVVDIEKVKAALEAAVASPEPIGKIPLIDQLKPFASLILDLKNKKNASAKDIAEIINQSGGGITVSQQLLRKFINAQGTSVVAPAKVAAAPVAAPAKVAAAPAPVAAAGGKK